MFEPGQFYGFEMWEPGDGGMVVRFTARITEVSLPLICFKGIESDGYPERIVNTSSLAFISATKLTCDPNEWLEEVSRNSSPL